ncbi:MAG: thioredoxin [Brumimicrobium sp.]
MSKFDELVKGNTPVLVDFYADWCGPCQTMNPIIKEVKNHFGDQLKVIKINVDTNPVVAQRFKIRGVPTFILFKNGEIEWKAAGVQSRRDLKEVVEKTLR